jgi:hypothetical protein
MPNKEGHPPISKNSPQFVPEKYMFSKLNNIHSLQVTKYHTLQAQEIDWLPLTSLSTISKTLTYGISYV